MEIRRRLASWVFRASTYIVPIICIAMLDRRVWEYVLPLTIAVCTVGCVDTLMETDAILWKLSSLVAHLCLPLFLHIHMGWDGYTMRGTVLAAAVLAGILGAYVVSDTWPYRLSMSNATLLAVCALLWTAYQSA